MVEDGDAVSVCFCARRSSAAAEAGLETAAAFRGRGLGPAAGSGVGIGGSSDRPHSPIQHVVVERRFAVGCAQVGSGGVCERVEFGEGVGCGVRLVFEGWNKRSGEAGLQAC